MKKVIINSVAVYQQTQQPLNGLNGIIINDNDEHEIIVKLDNGLELPFDKSELIYT